MPTLGVARPRGLHRRDKLVALFWPESDGPHAGAALNQALYVLRTALGDQAILARGDEDVGLNGDAVWCDAAAFEAHMDAGQPAEGLALYRGDLLDGFHVSDAPEFERWLDAERERLRLRASDAAWALAESSAAEGDPISAERWATRAAELQPSDEAVVRRLMVFLTGLGDRAAAIRAYETAAARMQQEYGVTPSSETRDLARAIREEAHLPAPVPKVGAPAVAPAGSLTSRPPFPAPVPEAGAPAVAPPGSVASKPMRRLVAWLTAAAIALIVAVAALVLQPPEPPRLAVLPFQNLGSAEDDYFAAGITDEITGRLSEIGGLLVISRTSTDRYRTRNLTLRQIAEELGVQYALEGSIRTDRHPRGEGDVRVTVSLIRAADDAPLWSEQYTSKLLPGEILQLQADIAERVAEALGVRLLPRERRSLSTTLTEDQGAYEYYLRGRQYYRTSFNELDTRMAEQMFARAMQPTPISPWPMLAWPSHTRGCTGSSTIGANAGSRRRNGRLTGPACSTPITPRYASRWGISTIGGIWRTIRPWPSSGALSRPAPMTQICSRPPATFCAARGGSTTLRASFAARCCGTPVPR